MTPIDSLRYLRERTPPYELRWGVTGEGRRYSSREKEVRSVGATPYSISPPLSPARVRYAEHTSAFSSPTASSFLLHPVPGVPSPRSANNNALLPSGAATLQPDTRHRLPSTRRDASRRVAECSRLTDGSRQITGFGGIVFCDGSTVYDFRKAIPPGGGRN